MTILVDTNVLLDVIEGDPVWQGWSVQAIDRLKLSERLIVNPVVYAELSVDFPQMAEVDAALAAMDITLAEIPRAALFMAGKAFRQYRARGGGRSGVLPDFFIGAHAAILGVPLLTRDAGRYRTYFPTLELIAPEARR